MMIFVERLDDINVYEFCVFKCKRIQDLRCDNLKYIYNILIYLDLFKVFKILIVKFVEIVLGLL